VLNSAENEPIFTKKLLIKDIHLRVISSAILNKKTMHFFIKNYRKDFKKKRKNIHKSHYFSSAVMVNNRSSQLNPIWFIGIKNSSDF
jgi:hypothetical protein